MSNLRLSHFDGLISDPWYGAAMRKLNRSEHSLCVAFLVEHEKLDKGAFEMAVNRMFLDKMERPKNWTLIADLLTAANIKAYPSTFQKRRLPFPS